MDPRAQAVAPLRFEGDRGAGSPARPGSTHVGLRLGMEVQLAWQSPAATLQGLVAEGGGPWGQRHGLPDPTVRPLLC